MRNNQGDLAYGEIDKTELLITLYQSYNHNQKVIIIISKIINNQ